MLQINKILIIEHTLSNIYLAPTFSSSLNFSCCICVLVMVNPKERSMDCLISTPIKESIPKSANVAVGFTEAGSWIPAVIKLYYEHCKNNYAWKFHL